VATQGVYSGRKRFSPLYTDQLSRPSLGQEARHLPTLAHPYSEQAKARFSITHLGRGEEEKLTHQLPL